MAIKWWVLLGGSDGSISYSTVQRALCLSDYYSLLFPNTLAVDATVSCCCGITAAAQGHDGRHPGGSRDQRCSHGGDFPVALAVTYGLRGSWPFSPAVAYAVLGIALVVLVGGADGSIAGAMTVSTGLLRSAQRAFQGERASCAGSTPRPRCTRRCPRC